MIAPLVALAVSFFTQPGLVWFLRRRAVLDHPNARSSHIVPTPRGGGLAVVLGMLCGFWIALADGVDVTYLVVAVLLFGLIGAAEDFHGLEALHRLALQLVAGVVAGFVVAPVTEQPAWWLVPCFAVWLAGYANAFNFMDGINGISGLNALVAGLFIAWIGQWQDDALLQGGGAVVAAAALGFLPWNAFKAIVFLGDSGSYALGAVIAALTGYALLTEVPVEAAVGPMAVYLADTTWTLARRVRAGQVWHEAHRSHVYQQLVDSGWSHRQVAAALGVLSAAVATCGLVSLGDSGLARVAADLVSLLLLCGYLAYPRLLAEPSQARTA